MGSKDQSWTTPLWFYNELKTVVKNLKLEFPDVDPAKRRELAAARVALEQEGNGGKGKKKKRARPARSEAS